MAVPKTQKPPEKPPELTYRLIVDGVPSPGHQGFKVVRFVEGNQSFEVDLYKSSETDGLKVLFDRQLQDPEYLINTVQVLYFQGTRHIGTMTFKDAMIISIKYNGTHPESKASLMTYGFAYGPDPKPLPPAGLVGDLPRPFKPRVW